MLAVPIPIILKGNFKPAKKAALLGVFSMGIFVILAAILNKYYNFSMPGTTVYMVWHIREASVSVMVANLMCWWPLLRKIFGWKAFVSAKKSLVRSAGAGGKRRWLGSKMGASGHDDRDVDLERTGSRDAIVHASRNKDVEMVAIEGISIDDESEASVKSKHEMSKGIMVTTEIQTNHAF